MLNPLCILELYLLLIENTLLSHAMCSPLSPPVSPRCRNKPRLLQRALLGLKLGDSRWQRERQCSTHHPCLLQCKHQAASPHFLPPTSPPCWGRESPATHQPCTVNLKKPFFSFFFFQSPFHIPPTKGNRWTNSKREAGVLKEDAQKDFYFSFSRFTEPDQVSYLIRFKKTTQISRIFPLLLDKQAEPCWSPQIFTSWENTVLGFEPSSQHQSVLLLFLFCYCFPNQANATVLHPWPVCM